MQFVSHQDFFKLYEYACLGNQFAHIDEWAHLIYEDEFYMEMELKANEAIARGDDFLFGFESREEFREAVFMQNIHDHALKPKVEHEQVIAALLDYIATHQIATFGFNAHAVMHPPVKGVW